MKRIIMSMFNPPLAKCLPRLGAFLIMAIFSVGGPWGCSGTLAPRVRVLDASVTETSGEAAVVSFLLELENPNAQPLQLREFHYSVSIDGGLVFQAVRSAEATLPQHSTQRMFLPGVIPFASLGQVRGGSYVCLLAGQVTYTAPGQLAEILFDAEIQVPRAGFSGAPQVEFPSP